MTISKPQLGRLERLNVREYWASEASEFTPWLAQADNISLLGDTIGLELEVESVEKHVGPFRADILCRDTATDSYVLIENQLEWTDHRHLGQLMTYAAGLEAVTIVWLAAQFTAEHRAALDWLNRITSPEFNFFGLEIELWRIGDSPMAPKFNVISRPNDWSKTVRDSTRGGGGEVLTPLRQLQLEFWTQFRQYMEHRNPSFGLRTPRPHYEMLVAIGRRHFHLAIWNFVQQGDLGVVLQMVGQDAKGYFHALQARKAEIEAALGPLTWTDVANAQRCRVAIWRKAHASDRSTWPELNEWIAERVEQFHRFFRPMLHDLQAIEEPSGATVEGLDGVGEVGIPDDDDE